MCCEDVLRGCSERLRSHDFLLLGVWYGFNAPFCFDLVPDLGIVMDHG